MAYLTGDKFRNAYYKIQIAEAEKKRLAQQAYLDSKKPQPKEGGSEPK